MGPIGVAKHLAPYLSTHSELVTGGELGASPISAAPFGSASILTISYAYIRMMGSHGLTEATKFLALTADLIRYFHLSSVITNSVGFKLTEPLWIKSLIAVWSVLSSN